MFGLGGKFARKLVALGLKDPEIKPLNLYNIGDAGEFQQ